MTLIEHHGVPWWAGAYNTSSAFVYCISDGTALKIGQVRRCENCDETALVPIGGVTAGRGRGRPVKGEDTGKQMVSIAAHAVLSRVAELQTGNPRVLKVVAAFAEPADMKPLEAYFHDCFSDRKVHGEWYDCQVEEVEEAYEQLMGIPYFQRTHRKET